MRIKLALWMAPLTLSLATSWGGVCFAQSGGLAEAPQGEGAEVAHATLKELVVAAVLPKSMDQPNIQTDETAADTGEKGGSGPAKSGPKESGQTAFSRIGIGVKISTQGAGIEVATPLAGKFNMRGGFNMFR
jgi:hypothetical protein